MEEQMSPKEQLIEPLQRLVQALADLDTAKSEAVPVFTNAPDELPQHSDSAEALVAWRTILERLAALAVAADEARACSLICANILVKHIRDVGLQDIILPQGGATN